MKKLHLTFCAMAFASLVVSFATSCDKDPVKPGNELHNKQHQDPVAAIFTLVEGELKGGKSFADYPKQEDFTATTKTQVIYYGMLPRTINGTVRKDSFGIDKAKGQDKFTVVPDKVYSLSVEYLDVKGNKMNDEFFYNDQDKIHQHFFQYFRINGQGKRDREKRKEYLPFDYTYADVWQGKFIGKDNPMGFYGFIKFLPANEKHNFTEYNIKMSLMHAGNTTKFDEQHRASDFWKPSASQLGSALWDLQAELPVKYSL